MEIRLPKDKVEKLLRALNSFKIKRKASKHEIEVLAGYITHCAKVVRGAGLFLEGSTICVVEPKETIIKSVSTTNSVKILSGG